MKRLIESIGAIGFLILVWFDTSFAGPMIPVRSHQINAVIAGPEKVKAGVPAWYWFESTDDTASWDGDFFPMPELETGLPHIVKGHALFWTVQPGHYRIVGLLINWDLRQFVLLSKVVEVEGKAPGPDPEPPDPEPPDPEPPDPWNEFAVWVTSQVELAIPSPGRKEAAAKLVGVIAETRALVKDGTITTSRQFRETLKRKGLMTLGWEVYDVWEDKFDNPILTPRIVELGKEWDLENVNVLSNLFSWVSKGLSNVSGTSKCLTGRCTR